MKNLFLILPIAFGLMGCSPEVVIPPVVTSPTLTNNAEFHINTDTTNNQLNSKIAMNANGDFVVTWASQNQDGSSYGVYAQRYDSAGVAQGSEFKVNSHTTNQQEYPSIAIAPDGSFIITWQSWNQDGDGFGIYAQRYDSTGITQGTEFRVNTTTESFQSRPDIAIDANGNFVITWSGNGQNKDNQGIYAQRYNAIGTAQGTEFQVNSHTTDNQSRPIITMNDNGSFVIIWTSYLQDGSAGGIYAQRYDSAGSTQGAEFQVNTHTTFDQWSLAADMAINGDFIVAWQSNGLEGGGTNDIYYNIYAQRYNSAGVAQGSEFQVNSHTANQQQSPSITIHTNGGFLITCHSYHQSTNGYDVYARHYNAAGLAEEIEYRVNTFTTGNQWLSSAAADANGNFVITWQSANQEINNFLGIYGKRYYYE